MRRGIPVSPGVVVGTAYCIDDVFVAPHESRLAAADVEREQSRFEAACQRVAAELRALRLKVHRQIGPDEAAVFAMHESILADATMLGRVRHAISEKRISAQAALQELLQEYTVIFHKTADEYLRDRVNDLRDVVVRLSAHLSDVVKTDHDPLPHPLVVVANDLLPSHAVTLGQVEVEGIVTEAGSQTSHAAIIARSRGIPAVAGVRGILNQVKTGDPIIVDGRQGTVIVQPDAETAAAYRKLEREFLHLRDELALNRSQPAVTEDGVRLELLANINGLDDTAAAHAMGASGVGLFRTEYLYLVHPDIPEEEEQFDIYRKVVETSPNHQVTIRTLDIGGDKTVAYLGTRHREANPFMGWRSIRLSFEHPQLLMTQVRAILRAGHEAQRLGGRVRILFPMITTLEEIHRIRQLVRRCRRQLEAEGRPHAPVPLGMMLEVPAAAVILDTLLPWIDFVSIGSNDLVQYLMAADRDNPKVSHLCQPLAPAVLRVLEEAIRRCLRANKPVTLCGEMAGQPASFVLLLGMGLRSFSMSPAFVPSIKELAAHVSIPKARALLERSMGMRTSGHIRRFLSDRLHEIAPNLDLFQ